MRLNLDKSTWKRVTFGDVIESITDRIDDPSKAGVDRYVGLEHLDPGVMTVQRWDTPDKVEAQKLRFQRGDVIFGRRRAYQKKVALAEFEGICSAHALVLRARHGLIDPAFLPVFLSSDDFLDRAIEISVGSLSPTINWRDLKIQQFVLPPLDEQKRIADLVWTIGRHHTAVANEPGEIGAAYDVWLERRIAGVPTQPLADVLELQHGRPVPSALYGEGTFPLLRPGDMNADGSVAWSDSSVSIPQRFVDQHQSWVLDSGDLVINMTAQSLEDRFLGRVCRMHDRALLNQRIGRLLTNGHISTDFAFVALHSASFAEWVARRSEGSKVKHLHWRHIADYPFPVPPADQQDVIVAEANAWSAGLQRSKIEASRLVALRSSVLAEVFGDN